MGSLRSRAEPQTHREIPTQGETQKKTQGETQKKTQGSMEKNTWCSDTVAAKPTTDQPHPTESTATYAYASTKASTRETNVRSPKTSQSSMRPAPQAPEGFDYLQREESPVADLEGPGVHDAFLFEWNNAVRAPWDMTKLAAALAAAGKLNNPEAASRLSQALVEKSPRGPRHEDDTVARTLRDFVEENREGISREWINALLFGCPAHRSLGSHSFIQQIICRGYSSTFSYLLSEKLVSTRHIFYDRDKDGNSYLHLAAMGGSGRLVDNGGVARVVNQLCNAAGGMRHVLMTDKSFKNREGKIPYEVSIDYHTRSARNALRNQYLQITNPKQKVSRSQLPMKPLPVSVPVLPIARVRRCPKVYEDEGPAALLDPHPSPRRLKKPDSQYELEQRILQGRAFDRTEIAFNPPPYRAEALMTQQARAVDGSPGLVSAALAALAQKS
ncbi:MAG: hypothetical protein KVP17_003432 [Porospora cf. gigantea B]|nr:MAG: hypothetical protein KVP17_003432 [Porospora cf. gigantea B]